MFLLMSIQVELSNCDPFACGGNRACYVDPRDEDRCIKVPLEGSDAASKRTRAAGLKRWRPLVYYDDNLREQQTYRRIERYLGEQVWESLPRCYGLVKTDLGIGIVTDLVRNADRSISICLKTKLRKTGYDQCFRSAVAAFQDYLYRSALPTRDLLLHNLVAQDDSSGNFRVFLIDGFGSADPLPYAYWSKSLARAKVRRKCEKLQVKIDDFMRKYSIPVHED